MHRLTYLVLIAMCAPVLAQEMEPGEWQFTTTMTSPMMPKPQVMTHTRCVKKGDTDPSKLGGDHDKGKSDCKMTPGKMSGGNYSWEVTCPQSGMKGSGTARATGTTVESEMRMSGTQQGKKFEMNTKTSGKRLGACKK